MRGVTERHLGILQHALGLDQYGQGTSYRNQYCAGVDDVEDCKALVAMGYMRQVPTTSWLPYFNCVVTGEGQSVVKQESPTAPKLTRSQRRYKEYLNAESGMTFIEWLRAPTLRSGSGGDSSSKEGKP